MSGEQNDKIQNVEIINQDVEHYKEQLCILQLIFYDELQYAKRCEIKIEENKINTAAFLDKIKLILHFRQHLDNLENISKEIDAKCVSCFGSKQIHVDHLTLKKVSVCKELLKNVLTFKIHIEKFALSLNVKEVLKKLAIIQHIHKVCVNLHFLCKNEVIHPSNMPHFDMQNIKEFSADLCKTADFSDFLNEIIDMHYLAKKFYQAVDEVDECTRLKLKRKLNWKTLLNDLDTLIKTMTTKLFANKLGSNFEIIDCNERNSTDIENLRSEIIQVLAEKHRIPQEAKTTGNNFESIVPTYNMEGGGILRAIIINNVNYLENPRHGADVNAKMLTYLFAQLQFDVEIFQDVTREMLFNSLIKRANFDKVQCLILIAMGHGNDIPAIMGIDGSNIVIQDILNFFANDKCPQLKGKPKIFLFPVCRGYYQDTGVLTNEEAIETDGLCLRQEDVYSRRQDKHPNMSDTLVVYSTISGYVSYRRSDGTLPFISTLCDVFREYASSTHVEDMLKIVTERMLQLRFSEQFVQTPTYENIAFKNCYLKVKKQH